jgi:LmbE family N-acetylglucosaminyl deacetylase
MTSLQARIAEGTARLLTVFPHPDDESWAAGGLIARTARAGSIKLVTLSRGEAGRSERHPIDGQTLAELRTDELRNAARILGVSDLEVFDLPDGNIERAAVTAALQPVLEAFRPEVVLTFAPDGAYGHRDHVACVEGVLEACRPRFIPVLAVALPTNLLDPLRRAFAKRRPELLDPRYATCPLGDRADFELVLSPEETELKRKAIASHKSQLRREGPEGVDDFLGRGVIPTLLAREGYCSLPVTPSVIR